MHLENGEYLIPENAFSFISAWGIKINTRYHRISGSTSYYSLAFGACTGVHCKTPGSAASGAPRPSPSTVCSGCCRGRDGCPRAPTPRPSADAAPAVSWKQPCPPSPRSPTAKLTAEEGRERSAPNPAAKGTGEPDNRQRRSPFPTSKVYGFVYSWATLLAQALRR